MIKWLICKDSVLGICFQLMMVTGIAVINGLGIENAVHWGTITLLCTIPAILTILAVIFVPESPFYLVGKDREEDALKSLVRLRGSTFDVNSELKDLKRSYKNQTASSSFSYTKLFTEDIYFKPFIVVLVLMFNQQFSGINAVYMNLKPIFLQAGSQLDAGLSSFIISIVRVRNNKCVLCFWLDSQKVQILADENIYWSALEY